MNRGEWGIRFLASTGFDLSGFDTLTISFTKPDGTALAVTDPAVTAPNTDVETTEGLFPANTYVSYTFVDGDVDQAGTWSVRVTYEDAGQKLISDTSTFTVNP